MSWIMVDVEADGPCPGVYSMTELGMVVIRDDMKVEDMPSFYGRFAPLPGAKYMQEALDVCSRTREQVEGWPTPFDTMLEFKSFLNKFGGRRPMFISDNNGFDFQFVNYYAWRFLGENPFGHSSMNLGSLFKGAVHDTFQSFKYLRDTKHTHHPVDDCRGNVEALLKIKQKYEMRMKLK